MEIVFFYTEKIKWYLTFHWCNIFVSKECKCKYFKDIIFFRAKYFKIIFVQILVSYGKFVLTLPVFL